MRQIAYADRTAADLIFISRANAAPGRADLARPCGLFAQAIKVAVERQDERAIFRNMERVGRDGDALGLQLFDLGLERPRVEDNTIADDARRAAHDTGGEQRKLVNLVADDERVTGIMPALKADHDIGALGEPVDDLAFAFVAPLRADYCHIRHV